MIQYMGTHANMFDHWGLRQCPVIPTNLTAVANAGIAAEIRKHIPAHEFEQQHRNHRIGGLLQFSDGRIAWDLPTKRTLLPGSTADTTLMNAGLNTLWRYGVARLKQQGIEVILIPRIGAGLGGLPWSYVWHECGPTIERIAKEIDVALYTQRLNSSRT